MCVPTSISQINLGKRLAASAEASTKRFNVLLVKEAQVPYDKVVRLEPRADVCAKCTGSQMTCIKTRVRIWLLAEFCIRT